MALVIQTNNAAVTAQKNINTNTLGQNKALNRLSSGFRINSAADDAAGFAISSKLDAQGSRLKAAVQNASQATALVKTAEAGVNEIQNMIVRLQTLAIQAASANNAGELTQLDAERSKLVSSIDKIANSTNFNGTNLLNGLDANSAAINGTAATGQSVTTAGGGIATSATVSSANIFESAVFTVTTTAGTAFAAGTPVYTAGANTGLTGVSLVSNSNAVNDTYTFDFASNGLTVTIKDAAGATQGTKLLTTGTAGTATANQVTLTNGAVLGFTIGTTDTTNTGAGSGGSLAVTGATAAAGGTVTSVVSSKDLTDIAGKVTATAGTNLLASAVNRPVTAGNLVLTLTNTGGTGTAGSITIADVAAASQTATTALAVTTTGATTGTAAGATAYTAALVFQVGAENNANDQVTVNLQNKYTTAGLALTGDLTSATNAKAYITTLKTSLDTLIAQRADLGATSNQLGFVQANLATSIEQVSASVSSIRDADIAAEIANFTKSQILVQAGTAMLAQANQASKNVLRLFQ